jgi:hypothetical protein
VGTFLQKSRTIVIQTFIIIILTFLLGEISLRIYQHFNPVFIFYNNSYNRFRGKPHAIDWDFALNSRGFKDKEVTEKNKDTYRIIGIGDSFTFGVVPYKYNYLTLLEQGLSQHFNNVEILNMGIPSIGPKGYLALLVKEGLELKPDMLLLTFYIGNDFTDCLVRKKLYEYSYVASLIKYLITLESKFEGIAINPTGDYPDDKPTMNQKTYTHIMEARSCIYQKGNKEFEESVDKAVRYLSLINAICKKKNIEFVVVIAPDEFQISKTVRQDVIEAFYANKPKPKWDIALPNKTLIDNLDNLGIKYIDLYPYFQEASGRLYRVRDTHWNIAGNALAAKVIQDQIGGIIGAMSSRNARHVPMPRN